jgi:hypothetical protein
MSEHLRRAIDHLHEGVQVISSDWRYLYVNETAASHGRRSAAELLGERLHDGSPGIAQTPLFVALERAMTTRQAERMRNELEYPSGMLHEQRPGAEMECDLHEIEAAVERSAASSLGCPVRR